MKLLASDKRERINHVIERNPSYSIAMVMGRLMLDPELESTVERMMSN